MKMHWKLLMIVMSIFPVILTSFISAYGLTVYVDADAPTGGDGSASNPFKTIREGIILASAGDTVLIRDGVYTGAGNKNLDLAGKAITIRSENGAGHTVIDCQGSGRGFYLISGEGNDSVIDGITITNGSAGTDGGGGILCAGSHPTIQNCIIRENIGSPEINGGGGIYASNSSAKIVNCLITKNTALVGGGISASDSSLDIINCTFFENSVSGVYAEPYFVYCGGAVFCLGGSARITNSAFWSNLPDQIDSEGNVSVTYSDIQGGYPGTGNINVDPLFVNPAAGDFDLSRIAAGQTADSPCVNSGDPGTSQEILNILSGRTTRTDGETDVGIVDMGFHYDLVEVSVIKTGTGSGTVSGNGIDCNEDCAEDFSQGITAVTLTAVADQGSDFTGWSGGGCSIGDCVLTLNGNISIYANFEMNSGNNTDSDNDGLLDWLEYQGCTDSLNPDTDGDGRMDGEEDANHNGSVDAGETDPCNPDSDGDGMDDGWEVQYGLNPLSGDGHVDSDNDGLTNYEEFRLMSDPTSSDDPQSFNMYEYDELGRIKKIIRKQHP